MRLSRWQRSLCTACVRHCTINIAPPVEQHSSCNGCINHMGGKSAHLPAEAAALSTWSTCELQSSSTAACPRLQLPAATTRTQPLSEERALHAHCCTGAHALAGCSPGSEPLPPGSTSCRKFVFDSVRKRVLHTACCSRTIVQHVKMRISCERCLVEYRGQLGHGQDAHGAEAALRNAAQLCAHMHVRQAR